MLPRAVLFDLDGTLIDSIPLIVASMRHAFDGHPRPPPVDEWVALIGTPLDTMIRRWAGDEADVAQVKERYKAHQWAHHDAMVRAFPGIPGLLDTLTSRGVRMAVVTSKLEPSARRSLEFLGLAHHFALPGRSRGHRTAQAGSGARSSTPSRSSASRRGRPAFVGDSPHDVLAGNAAGVATVATLWGPFSREQLAPARPRPGRPPWRTSCRSWKA